MILEEFDEERFKRNMRQEGYEDGLVDGEARKAIKDAENLLRENITPEIIARCTGLPIEQIHQLAEKISVHA